MKERIIKVIFNMVMFICATIHLIYRHILRLESIVYATPQAAFGRSPLKYELGKV